jgi:hypothetical protein
MLDAVAYLKEATSKPIYLNTNIDAADKNKIVGRFHDLLTSLGSQGKLGFDIYPSQETWRLAPLQKLRRFIQPYFKSLLWAKKTYPSCEMYFAEIEAQPWGGGQSWFTLINQAPNPDIKILTYSKSSLQETWKNHIELSGCEIMSLWGADFWLSANKMGITWPLQQVKGLLLPRRRSGEET